MSYGEAGVLTPKRSLVLADLVPGERARDVAVVAAAACFVGLLAQISFKLPGTPVPITGQTLGVLLAGSALGARRGMASMVLYAVTGLIGVPWFAGHTAGWPGASFGYIVGFVFAAGVCGALADHRQDRRSLRAVVAMAAGTVAVYAVGLPWLAVSLHLNAAQTLAKGFTPFLLGDAVKAMLAGGLLPMTWRAVGHSGRQRH